ncbi:MAG TPA: hypothetical protein VMY35_05235 [Phycisphaerae bacterium]|nr:hypothetical protein [Phycisphaerae bacterium]
MSKMRGERCLSQPGDAQVSTIVSITDLPKVRGKEMPSTATEVCWTAAGPPVPFMGEDTAPVYDDQENNRFIFFLPVKEDLEQSRAHIRGTRKGCGLIIAQDGWQLFLRVIAYCKSGVGETQSWAIPVTVPYWAGAPSKDQQTKAAVRAACESIQEGTIVQPWDGKRLSRVPPVPTYAEHNKRLGY